MAKTLEFIFDFVSPNAYLAWYPVKDIVARTGATLEVTPVFLGGMHRLTGNAPPFQRDAEVKGKNAYAMLEMRRFIARYGLGKFAMHPQFPFNSVTLQRMLLAVEGERRVALADALLPAIWESGEDFRRSVANIGREATIKAMAKTTPLGRFASSEEMADTILYLLSDAASNITGHVMVSDGGFII